MIQILTFFLVTFLGLFCRRILYRRQKRVIGHFWMVAKDKDGNRLWDAKFQNDWLQEGFQDMLTQYLTGGTMPSGIFIGLIDDSGFSAISSTDTMSSHSGWTELTGYDEATRQEIDFDTISGGIASSTTGVTITASGTIAIKGAFLTTNSTKGGTTGVMIANATGTVQNLIITQTLDIFYVASLSG